MTKGAMGSEVHPNAKENAMSRTYTAADGRTITDKMIDRWCEAYDKGEFPEGERAVGEVVQSNRKTEGRTMFQPATLHDLPAFLCGHAQSERAATGCTAIIAPEGATCGVDVRGGGPATRETDLLRPENMVQQVHAVVLSGGSAFGLEASCGVMDALAERGIGFPLAGAHVPIVTGACLFDLLVGENAHPDKAMGRAAAEAAFAGGELAQGNVGAGCGATVGKLLGGKGAMKAGFGMAGVRLGEAVAVALVAVNALGSVRDEEGRWIAGCLGEDGQVMDPLAAMALAAQMQAAEAAGSGPCTNTTIGCVLTNARLTKAQATKAASTVHDAYARAIKPVHTSNDGDTVFVMASDEADCPPDLAAVLATEAMEKAILAAVRNATGIPGLPAAQDIA